LEELLGSFRFQEQYLPNKTSRVLPSQCDIPTALSDPVEQEKSLLSVIVKRVKPCAVGLTRGDLNSFVNALPGSNNRNFIIYRRSVFSM
jgi:hypothetical protein